jgi:branched-chain amino acid aminotransferase
MSADIAYLNGEYLSRDQARVPVTHRGFFGGDGVYEVTRTFGHELFRLEDHIDRLLRSLGYARIDPGLNEHDLIAISQQVVARNLEANDTLDDIILWHVVARGDRIDLGPGPALVAVFCDTLPFTGMAAAYQGGIDIVTPGVRRTAPYFIDPKAKVTSRMNQVQAALEATGKSPGSVPLMLDERGFLAETNPGNFFFVRGGRLMTSKPGNVLNGVTRGCLLDLAGELGIECVEGDFTPYDVLNADEAFVSSTSPVVLPVKTYEGRPLADTALPGPVTLRLIRAFIAIAGLDFVDQALGHLGGNEAPQARAAWRTRLEA